MSKITGKSEPLWKSLSGSETEPDFPNFKGGFTANHTETLFAHDDIHHLHRAASILTPFAEISPQTSSELKDWLPKAKEILHRPRFSFGLWSHTENVAKKLVELDPKKQPDRDIIEYVMLHFIEEGGTKTFEDNLIRQIAVQLMGKEQHMLSWFSKLSLPSLLWVEKHLREGFVGITGWWGPSDRSLYNQLFYLVGEKEIRSDRNLMKDPSHRRQWREKFQDILGNERMLRFRGKLISALKPLKDQPAIAFIYREIVERQGKKYNTVEAVEKVLASPKAKKKNGEDVELKGTVVYKPGLGNALPSAAFLAELAKHLGDDAKLVLAHGHMDKSTASRLRIVDEICGVPLPQQLQGKIFEIGTTEKVYQSYKTEAGIFLEQMNEIEEKAEEFSFDLSKKTAFCHSQGSATVVLARQVAAAHGEPDLIDKMVSLAGIFRSGAGLVDKWGSPLIALVNVLGGEGASRAVKDLDPDNIKRVIPEIMRETVDFNYLVSTSVGEDSDDMLMVSGVNVLSEQGLGESESFFGSDGLADARSARFSRSDREHMISSLKGDHYSVVLNPYHIHEVLGHVDLDEASPSSFLEKLAGDDSL